MQAPPWQPPGRPAPFAPASVPAHVHGVGAALLSAPIWERQADESVSEHVAFLAWLMGGYEYARPRGTSLDTPTRLVVRGDWAKAIGVLGGNSGHVHALAARWSWEVRGR